MNERKVDQSKGAAGWLAIVLLALVTGVALYLPHPLRADVSRKAATAKPVSPMRPVLPVVQVWLSTADRRLRLVRQPDIGMAPRNKLPDDIRVDTHASYQSMVGFGAAMTDASAWLLHNAMSAPKRAALLDEMFGPPPGLNLNMTRLTIGASDFSLKPYTLDDVPPGKTDPALKYFNAAPNLRDVVPMLREAAIINPKLHIIASPWSAPAWMKTSDNLISGQLLPDDERAYADYLVKYVDVLRDYGIPIFALTVQNEPAFEPLTYPGMAMPAATRARLIGQYLGRTLARHDPKTRILGWDHNWDQPDQPLAVLADPAAARYIDGIAWHCYRGTPTAQTEVHRAHPDKDVYITECSGGDWPSAKKGELLLFARDVLLAGIRQWARGVVYWNLILDEQHGPHFGGCGLCKGLVTIDSHTGKVSRNDEYYAFAHFSRFVMPGALRVGSSETDRKLNNVAFKNPSDGSVVLVVVNSHRDNRVIYVKESQNGFRYRMPPQSVATFVWNQDPAAAWIREAVRWLQSSTTVRQ